MGLDPLKIGREAVLSGGRRLYRRCVAFLDIGRQPYELASGTVITIGDRLFVATAAHAIPNNPEGRLWMLPGQPRRAEDGILGFVNFGKVASEHPDVGFLELTPESAAGYLEFEPCPIEQIRPVGRGRENKVVVLMGFPAENAVPKQWGPSATLLPAKSMAYGTVPLMESEQPPIPPGEPAADPSIDVFLSYPEDGTTQLETDEPITLPHPGGTSGGGVWDLGFEPGALWSPDSAFLFALQSRWSKDHRYLRAVQIIHWLRLIHDHYPDLRSTLEHRFPELRGGGD
jgi:hypothetical protein